MGENEDEKQSQAGQVFENFVQASTCKGTLQAFSILTQHLDLDPLDHRNFYSKLKSKVTTWKAKALWYKLDKRGSHKEYKRGKSCMNTKLVLAGSFHIILVASATLLVSFPKERKPKARASASRGMSGRLATMKMSSSKITSRVLPGLSGQPPFYRLRGLEVAESSLLVAGT
ncbi:Hypothetical predicted protein [Marmota monax]|uniref:Uncharacterized protein n=1 Tax=Marmota monax TaxID=9995 RepID=A0A5E4B884_MARMO|nr:hypothetical protein GHT09_013160 [Marmota monax]VTJ65081.1 Hypothetical predicted protein [Marmota monax]